MASLSSPALDAVEQAVVDGPNSPFIDHTSVSQSSLSSGTGVRSTESYLHRLLSPIVSASVSTRKAAQINRHDVGPDQSTETRRRLVWLVSALTLATTPLNTVEGLVALNLQTKAQIVVLCCAIVLDAQIKRRQDHAAVTPPPTKRDSWLKPSRLFAIFRRPRKQKPDAGLAIFDCDLSSALDGLTPQYRSALPADLPVNKGSSSLLDTWTQDEVLEALDRAKVQNKLTAAGFADFSLVFDTTDALQHRLIAFSPSLFSPTAGVVAKDRFLIDAMFKRRDTFKPSEMLCYQLLQRLVKAGSWQALHQVTGELRAPFVGIEGAQDSIDFMSSQFALASKLTKTGHPEWEVTQLDWVQMHNPFVPVTRPLLPGQRHPGLGVGKLVGAAMVDLAVRSPRTDALMNQPLYYHNAKMYHGYGWKHVDPVYEAYVQWLFKQMKPYDDEHGSAFVAHAITTGHLRRVVEAVNDDGTTEEVSSRLERWGASEQIFPTGKAAKVFVCSTQYQALEAKYRDVFEKDGGANMKGVHVKAVEADPRQKRARLVLNLEGCPELWKFSKVWKTRDPETGRF